MDQVEYRTVKYEHENAGAKKEDRFLITGYMPLSASGSGPARLYVGPKDHFILEDVSATLTKNVSRPVDLEGLIDYGWFSSVSRPLAVPILKSIKFLRELTNSFGLAIIIFTIIIYSLFSHSNGARPKR
ncbi:MAG: YidC/Oxa1 family insertase periplasmic-domain containing protein [Pyrinomonadaceae bacterium]